MRLAMVAAGFSAGEADALRRAMAAWRRRGGLEPFADRLIGGMLERGYSEEFARQLFSQIQGFGEYGFPESHAASFALLVYVSAWLKCHHPAAFTCALLNSQPMGFYAPAQLVQAARRQGVELRPVDVDCSDWDCSLERGAGGPALRLGLRMIRGLPRQAADRLVEARRQAPFTSAGELGRRSGLRRAELALLAAAGAVDRLASHRHRARWQLSGQPPASPLLPDPVFAEGIPLLPAPGEARDIAADYHSLGLTLRRHPLALLRDRLTQRGWLTAREAGQAPAGAPFRAAGLVISRQRPGSAGGVVFITLEDETGHLNLIVWPALRNVRDVALVLAPLLLAASLMIGYTVVFDSPFNFANVIVLPLLLGLGVDSSIHYVMRAREGDNGTDVTGTSTPRAVMISAMTTIGSFGTLWLSAHRGMASMGELLTIAILVTLVCTLIVLPQLIEWAYKKRASG